jgi:hypothetical protein
LIFVGQSVQEDKENRLERKYGDSKHSHRRLSREYNIRSETNTNNLGELQLL